MVTGTLNSIYWLDLKSSFSCYSTCNLFAGSQKTYDFFEWSNILRNYYSVRSILYGFKCGH